MGRFFFCIPVPLVATGILLFFGVVANPPEPAKATTVECLSITKGEAVADEPGKFKYTCQLR